MKGAFRVGWVLVAAAGCVTPPPGPPALTPGTARGELEALAEKGPPGSLAIVEECRDHNVSLEEALACAQRGIAPLQARVPVLGAEFRLPEPEPEPAALQPARGAISPPGRLDPATAKDLRFCESEWPSDYEMRLHCVEQQRAASNRVAEAAGRLPEEHPLRLVLYDCMARWEKSTNLFDWTMVDYCFKQQSEAREKLERMGGR